MKQIITIVTLLQLLLTNFSVNSQELNTNPLTFTDAYEQMNQNSYVLKQAEFEIREKVADRKAAFGLRTPHVFITANAVQMPQIKRSC